jgi:regulator of protease activity HflC (stomatin/prohibitin superfamily)
MLFGAGAAALVGIVCIVLGFTIVSVGPSQRLVVFNRLTGDLSTAREPGYRLINPITTEYRHYDVSRQTYTMSSIQFEGDTQGDDAVSARTSGGQEVLIDLTVIYRIDPERVNDVHVNWPNDRYRDELIRPLLRSVVRDAVSIFPIESVYQERATIDNQITEAVIPAMTREGFTVEDILVRNVTFATEYANAIEAAQVAEVNIREQEFRVREVEQQAAQVEARARGEAEARIIQAEADAQALRLVAEVLAENPNLLQYEYIQRLSDQVQLIALPANSPFIFDLQGISNLPQPGSPGGQSIIPSPDDD